MRGPQLRGPTANPAQTQTPRLRTRCGQAPTPCRASCSPYTQPDPTMPIALRIYATLFAALAGLAFGSFLNVCLTRCPAGESIAKPRSHCRNCGRTLAWWENIPLASWLALRGRCRTCGAWIGVRYPLVELAISVLWGFIGWRLM